MAIVNVYLNFDGNCEKAFNFYKSVFGGEFSYLGRFGDMPVEEGQPPVSEAMAKQIMHVSLQISKETALMGSDVGGEWAPHFKQGNNFSISVGAETKDEADRIFNGLAAGGQITMPLNKTFWGDYFGMLTDQFGINWMMSWNEERQAK
jgi:PhnB protein